MTLLSYGTSLGVFHVSKVATLTQVNAIYSQLYCHVHSVSQLLRNIVIAVFHGLSVFARLRRLDFIMLEARS